MVVILNDKLKVILSDKSKDKITNNYIEKFQIKNIKILKLVYKWMEDPMVSKHWLHSNNKLK